MIDIRQTPAWGKFLSQIGWDIEQAGKTQIFIRKIPLLRRSVIKIQHPQNPLPYTQIDQIAKKYRALFVVIEPEPLNFSESLLRENGYRKSPITLTHTATIHLDLQRSTSDLFSSFSENARRNIKKSEKNELEVKKVLLKEVSDDTDFQQFYALLTSLTKLKKFYVPGYSEYHKKYLAFKESSTLFFAYHQGKAVAAVWTIHFNDTMVYVHSGITEKGYEDLANYLLVWEALKFAKKLGLKTFEFEGIYDPRFPNERRKWKNFSEFKKRFHGNIVEYPHPYVKWHSNFIKLFYICSKIFSR